MFLPISFQVHQVVRTFFITNIRRDRSLLVSIPLIRSSLYAFISGALPNTRTV
jgi:hypothetical protein